MAFSPEADGENFQHADRPNVKGVQRDDGGDATWLLRGTKVLLVGAALGVAGFVVDLGGLLGDVSLSGANRVGGLGGLVGLIRGLLDLLAMLDDLMLLGGGLALLAAATLFGVYLHTREPTLRVDVAGDEDLTVPADPWHDGDVVGRLRRAIAPEPGATAPTDGWTTRSADAAATDAPGGDDPRA
jgi:hypothetical protein